MSSGTGSLPELIEKAPPRSFRQVSGAVALWTAVGTTAGVAVALALVVAPGRDERAAATPDKNPGRDTSVLAMAAAAAAEPAVAAGAAEPRNPAPSVQTAAVQPAAEPQAAARQAAAPNARPVRRQKRAAARARWPRFQAFGNTFAWSSPRNRSR